MDALGVEDCYRFSPLVSERVCRMAHSNFSFTMFTIHSVTYPDDRTK